VPVSREIDMKIKLVVTLLLIALLMIVFSAQAEKEWPSPNKSVQVYVK
jgi:hypothetical protein